MTDYDELSDFEINKRVALALSFEVMGDKTQSPSVWASIHPKRCWGYVDYCNNPADAWPIIVENNISLFCHGDLWVCEDLCGNCNWIARNPLQAAMVCFLMMNEKDGVL